MRNSGSRTIGLLIALVGIPFLARPVTADETTIAARINGTQISTAQVERQLQRVLGDRSIERAMLAALRKQALQHLIDQQLVLLYLAETGDAASAAEITRAIQRLQKSVQQQELEWTEYLERAGLSEAEFRRQYAWQIGWTRFLEKHATDQNLERYFQQHRRDFDGTQVRAAHILLPIASPEDAQVVSEAVASANRIRAQIIANQMTFVEAAKRFSSAPTAETGGQIGLIRRREPMPESFSAAAFALDIGQVSEPVVSPFGVHLIQSVEIEPGDKTWRDVRGDLYKAVAKYLFDWAADRQRPKATVELVDPME